MQDSYGRTINYMRISITDRCNLRCSYCMPHGLPCLQHTDLLSYEEILRIARCAASLGITRFKVTGGEPLVRRDACDFIAALKKLPGVQQVTLTTNGCCLEEFLPSLKAALLDGINISMDTLDAARYRQLTGTDAVQCVLSALHASIETGIRTKLNCVLLKENGSDLIPLASLAATQPLDVRFIELMPIGEGGQLVGLSSAQALAALQAHWPDLHPVQEVRGNGPARYYASEALRGRIGLIDAVSHRFCADCNRVRLTCTGWLKPCLCYENGVDLRGALRSGCTDAALTGLLAQGINSKPQAHCFADKAAITEHHRMSQIGG